MNVEVIRAKVIGKSVLPQPERAQPEWVWCRRSARLQRQTLAEWRALAEWRVERP
jgi:hypothetical protein